MEKSSLKFSWDQDKPIIEKEDRWTLSKVNYRIFLSLFYNDDDIHKKQSAKIRTINQ